MNAAFAAALLLCLAAPARAAYDDEALSETVAVSTDTAEEEAQPVVQESDEDLAAFVTDYIRKDIQLKGAFFIEDRASKRVLKLELASVEPKAAPGGNGARSVGAVFRDPAGKKFTVRFWVQDGPWGGIDIFRMDLLLPGSKPEPELKPAPKKKGK